MYTVYVLNIQHYMVPSQLTHLHNISTFSKKQPLNFRLLFLKHMGLFPNLPLFLYLGRTLIPEWHIDPEIIFDLR